MIGENRWIFRVLMQLAGLTLASVVQAQTYTVLHNFTGGLDGASPLAGVILDNEGNVYGTAAGGGSSCCGTVFKLDHQTGVETVLYNFTGQADGGSPVGRLVRDAAGSLYGTAQYGGDFMCNSYNHDGCGTVFKVDTGGTETVLHTFSGEDDGCYPKGGLLMDKRGNLYGTTSDCGSVGGIVFRLDKAGQLTLLHNFTGSDGSEPIYTSLIMDKKGDLYGVTYTGGDSWEGAVYRLSKNGTETLLHSFTGLYGDGDGCYPFGTPSMDKSGALYGTTNVCGYSSGIVWKVSKKGHEAVLHKFTGSDGAEPIAGAVMDAKGNLYGDTSQGGKGDCGGYGCGTVYKLSRSGKLTVLHFFNGQDGNYPFGDLIRDAEGNLYGTTGTGGMYKYGTVWKLTP